MNFILLVYFFFYLFVLELGSLLIIINVSCTIVFDYTNFISSDFGKLQGVMGLAPTASPGSDLFVEVLKKQGIIDVAAFSIDYRYINNKYSMTFGGIDTERAPSLDNFTFTNLDEEDSWTVAIASMKSGDLEFGGQAIKATLDTHSSDLWLPPEDYKRWLNYTTFKKSCSKSGQYYRCRCTNAQDESIHPIYITFGGYEYKMKPENFLQVSYDNRQRINRCIFKVRESPESSNSTVILGRAFLKNFDVYYDLENKQIGLYGESMVYTGAGGRYSSGHPSGSNTQGGGTEGGSTETGEPEEGAPESGSTEGGDTEGGETEGGEPTGGDTESGEPTDGETEEGKSAGFILELDFKTSIMLASILIASLILNLIC